MAASEVAGAASTFKASVGAAQYPARLSFQDLMDLLPEHTAKPHPDRVARDWFNLAVQVAGVDGDGRVDCNALFQQWSMAVASRRTIIEELFAKYGTRGKRGTLTEADFGVLAQDLGFGSNAVSLFEELPKVENTRIVRYPTLMINIAARGASNEMKLFLTAMACRNPPKAAEHQNQSGAMPIRRRVWRPGPPRLVPPSEATVHRRQLLTARQATDHPSSGEREFVLAQRREDELWDRCGYQKVLEERRVRRAERELDVLVRKSQAFVQRNPPLLRSCQRRRSLISCHLRTLS